MLQTFLFLFSTFSSSSSSFLILSGPLILPFLVLIDFSYSFLLSYFLAYPIHPFCLFFLLCSMKDHHPHLIWFFWGPNFFSYLNQFPFWAKHPHPDANCLSDWLIFRNRSSKGGSWFINPKQVGLRQYNWTLALKILNFYCGSSNLKTEIILSLSQAVYKEKSLHRWNLSY